MANNPFDPQIIQVKRTLERGGMAGANKGFGSVRSSSPSSRPAPGPQSLDELDDVDIAEEPTHGDTLVYNAITGLWEPGAGGGGGGGGGIYAAKAASLIIPSANSWYSNANGYAISNPQYMHDGVWGGGVTNIYAGVGDATAPHMILDLQTIRELSHIEFAPYLGDNRKYKGIRLSTSLDNVNWTWLLWTPQTHQWQNYYPLHVVQAQGRTARYVRFSCYGSTANTGNHLEEFRVWALVDPNTIV